MSRKSQNSLVKNVAAIAGILIVFVVILRAALAPLYQEVAQMETEQRQLADTAQNGSGSSGGGNGGGSGENINVNIGGGLFNWALGWLWSGPGWYGGPDYGWWGANVWNGWRNWWTGTPVVYGRNVENNFNRDVTNEFGNEHGGEFKRDGGGIDRMHGGDGGGRDLLRDEERRMGGGDEFHGGGGHGGEGHGGGGHR
jgi:hypothetical protein